MVAAIALAFVACGDGGGGATPAPTVTPSPSLPAGSATAPAKPSATAAPSPTAPQPSVDVEVGQLIMAGVGGTSLSDDARHVIGDLHVGNIILMGRNVQSPEQVLALTKELQAFAQQANGYPLLIGTDQEGGAVQRLQAGFTRLPDAVTAGNAGDAGLTQQLGKVAGDELAAVGVNLDFAPDLDVNDNPANPVIGPRAFGSTPGVVSAHAVAFMQGLQAAGVIPAGKHFPGHGNTSQNSHYALPVVNKDLAGLQATEFRPFEAAIKAGIDALMIAHVSYPALDNSGLPATVSQPIVTGLLRDEFGFDGVVFTDDIGMKGIADLMQPEEAAVRAVLAGADVVLCVRMRQEGSCAPETLARLRNGLMQAVADGRISRARLDASFERVIALKHRYKAGPASGEGLPSVGSEEHRAVVARIERAAERR